MSDTVLLNHKIPINLEFREKMLRKLRFKFSLMGIAFSLTLLFRQYYEVGESSTFSLTVLVAFCSFAVPYGLWIFFRMEADRFAIYWSDKHLLVVDRFFFARHLQADAVNPIHIRVVGKHWRIEQTLGRAKAIRVNVEAFPSLRAELDGIVVFDI